MAVPDIVDPDTLDSGFFTSLIHVPLQAAMAKSGIMMAPAYVANRREY